jgi:hypothetical protein
VALRADPVGRGLNGTDPYWELRNQDPAYHYVWALSNSEAQHGGVDWYEAMGYEVVAFHKDGTHPRVGKFVVGDPITRRGHTLMRILQKEKDAHEAGIQAQYDLLERSMINDTRNQLDDGLRGLRGNRGSQYVRLDVYKNNVSTHASRAD